MDQETKQIKEQLMAEITREMNFKFQKETYFKLNRLTAEAKAKGLDVLAESLESATLVAEKELSQFSQIK